MIIKKKDFIPIFLKYVERLCERSLPEEEFEQKMFNMAIEEISKHNGKIQENLKWP